MKSTMKAELTALDTAGSEAEWLRDLLMDLPVVEKPIPAISMNYDNQTVIMKVNSSKDNMKSTRHVKRRLKSISKLRNSGCPIDHNSSFAFPDNLLWSYHSSNGR